ncbi:uncharacterized protein BX663DRAFT_491653 [Cokeromyces recurvatus]|uniref:uncharacterized protein n=1 Tax=Cokeromyces recurvatus TaxID=90255 RepID=UPI0022202CBA|nr:uncharacterized protein BX663DRAFT_491653 [Cokeromyces recurvatus]KAI7907672.1 hypothetical protein BX663DRAFT_491653 [Cokeromyces recurvatus]
MVDEGFNQIYLRLDAANEVISKLKPVDVLEEAKEYLTDAEENAKTILRSKEELNKELQRQLEVLKVKEATVIEEYRTTVEKNNTYEEEKMKQESMIKQEEQRQVQLSEEIRLLEKELEELDKPNLSDNLVDVNELRLAIYRGLGVRPRIEDNNKIEKVILSKYG